LVEIRSILHFILAKVLILFEIGAFSFVAGIRSEAIWKASKYVIAGFVLFGWTA